MHKIPTLFVRDFKTRKLTPEVNPGCEWVIAGQGIATIKWDGTSCMVKDGKLYKRYDAKHGKTPPSGFISAQEHYDPVTNHWPGWLAVDVKNSGDRWHCEAIQPHQPDDCKLPDGTYELVGPKIQGNPYDFNTHRLILHGKDRFMVDPPLMFDRFVEWFNKNPSIEGVVWHHPDGRMAKIKRTDFGLPWPLKLVSRDRRDKQLKKP